MKFINRIGLTLIFVVFFVNTGLCDSGVCATIDSITVDATIQSKVVPERALLQLSPTYAKYRTIEYELNKLKRSNPTDKVRLDQEPNRTTAPVLLSILDKLLKATCLKAGIQAPPIVVYMGNSNDTYNASAGKEIEYWRQTKTVTSGKTVKKFVTNSKLKKCTLTLGENLIKLFLWDANGEEALQSIIAHEVGHMCQDEGIQPKTAEYDADAKAINLLGKSNGRVLIQAINIATLSGHIFNILAGQSGIFKLSLDDIHQLNRIITSSIIKIYPLLGDLGQCSSHVKLGHVVNKVFQDALKYSFNPKIGLTEDNFFRIYEKLEKACKNIQAFLGQDQDAEVSLKCAYIEEYSSRFYSPVTHPTPLQRHNHIMHCIKH